jgi:hypothetical protein
MSREQIAKLVAQLETEMRSAARELEFERAAALRDQIQDIRHRVLEEDASTAVLRAAERAAGSGSTGQTDGARPPTAKPSQRAAAVRSGNRRGRRTGAADAPPALEVTSVTVLEAGEEPAGVADGHGHEDEHDPSRTPDTGTAGDRLPSGDHDHDPSRTPDTGTAGDWLPGLRDEHEGDDAGWMARWLDRPTWDHRVTPNVIKRTGTRPPRRRR